MFERFTIRAQEVVCAGEESHTREGPVAPFGLLHDSP